MPGRAEPAGSRTTPNVDGRRAARQGASVLDADSRVIGQVTSGSFSPTLDRPIAMAYLDAAVVTIGTSFDIDIRGTRVSATIVPLPFYKKPSSL